MDDRSIEEWVDAVEKYWRRSGMVPPERRRLVAELLADLENAIRGDVRADDLVARDVPAFAREVAEAESIELAHDDTRRVPTGDELAKTATQAGRSSVLSWRGSG